jgi:PTS system ascorbate-specific IIA component
MPEPRGSTLAPAGGPRLTQLIHVEAIRLHERAVDWRAAVRLAGDALVASRATTPAYTDEMVATVEQLGPYIVLAPGIALAHARPSPAVLRTGMSLVTLVEPVPFGHRTNDPVHLVIGLAATDEAGHMTALSTLAELLADEGRRVELMAALSPADVIRLVRTFEGRQATEVAQ